MTASPREPREPPQIEGRILTLRGERILLDADLASLYGVTTGRLNEAVKRNAARFPSDFMFQLTRQEVAILISQNAISKRGHGGRATRPHAFTEHGAVMAANVLRSDQAVQMSVFVVRAFVKMREQLMDRADLEQRLATIEKSLLAHDTALRDLYHKIRPLLLPPPDPPRKSIGFHPKESRPRYAKRKRPSA